MATAVPERPALARDAAFERLYRRHAKDVYRYALALLRDPAEAEDVTQTTFLNAYRAFKRGERPRKPQNWLIKIAHNAARSRYARLTRRVKEVPLEDHLDSFVVPDDERPDVAVVLKALGALPLNQRAALVMRELEGRSYAEIADTLNVSVAAVETLIFRARRSLKLKASSVRVLSLVQLPPSLAHLFEGGAVVAGGGGVFGSSFIFKAAVVVVAGAVATGVTGGNHAGPAEAAPASTPVTAPPWQSVRAFAGATALPWKAPARVLAVPRAAPTPREAVVAGRPQPGPQGGSAEAATPTGSVAVGGLSSAPAPVSEVVDPSGSTATVASSGTKTSPVTQVVQTVPVVGPSLPAVPALPAAPTAPALPPVPAAPALPPVPAAPALPPVPDAPATPAVPSVPVPPAPPLPTLP